MAVSGVHIAEALGGVEKPIEDKKPAKEKKEDVSPLRTSFTNFCDNFSSLAYEKSIKTKSPHFSPSKTHTDRSTFRPSEDQSFRVRKAAAGGFTEASPLSKKASESKVELNTTEIKEGIPSTLQGVLKLVVFEY